jgi:hypothetical protein
MANRHRGEVDLRLGEEALTLRLTLGALAEIEAAFGASDLVALGERLQSGRLSARDLIPILGAAARGGGQRMSDSDLAARIGVSDLPACAAAVGELFALTFGEA